MWYPCHAQQITLPGQRKTTPTPTAISALSNLMGILPIIDIVIATEQTTKGAAMLITT